MLLKCETSQNHLNFLLRFQDFCTETSEDDQFLIKHVGFRSIIKGCI
jgi:hypothetical protein